MKKILSLCLLSVSFCFAPLLMAQIQSDTEVGQSMALSPEGSIRQRLAISFPLKEVRSVKSVANGSLYHVEFLDGLSLYALASGAASGQYLLTGKLYETHEAGYTNLTEQARQSVRAEQLAQLQPNEYLLMGAEQQPAKAVVYVYVDIDCYYCQLQHAEATALNAAGVELRYLALNRHKPKSSAYNKVLRTWCSDEPQVALDMLMQGRSLKAKQCTDGLMAKHVSLAASLGVKRLPAIVTSDGQLLSGLVRAPQLLSHLGIELVAELGQGADAADMPAESLPKEASEVDSSQGAPAQ